MQLGRAGPIGLTKLCAASRQRPFRSSPTFQFGCKLASPPARSTVPSTRTFERPAQRQALATRASAATRDAAAIGVGSGQQQQQQLQQQLHLQQQQPLSPAAMTGGSGAPLPGAAPSMCHPGALTLALRDGRVETSDGQVVLDALLPGACLNPKESRDGAVVLGLASSSGPVSSLDVAIGTLRFRRFLACARNKLWWMTPEWGSSSRQLPVETQYLLLELEQGGPYALLLPLIDGEFRATLRPARGADAKDGRVVLRIESGDDTKLGESWDNVLLIAASNDPYRLTDAAVAAAAALSGGARPRSLKRLPSSLDSFGWCTWDAFYSTVSARGLVEGLCSLRAGGVKPRTLIIDDGWQLTDVDPPYSKAPTSALAARLPTEMPGGREAAELLERAEDDFYRESAKLLGNASEQMPQEVRNIIPTVANMQAPSHMHHSATQSQDGGRPDASIATTKRATGATVPQPAAAADSSPSGKRFLLARLAQKLAGALAGLATASFLIFYQWVIEPAPPSSLRTRAFAAAAQGVLRGAMLTFFASSTDFSRRLTGVRANSKFSSIDAGPENDWETGGEDLKGVVAQLKQRFGVHTVYCWHALPAYWGGVMPGSPEMEELVKGSRVVYPKPTDGVSEIEPSMLWGPAVLAGVGVSTTPSRLYHAMHAYLAASGVDGVKVDAQAGVGLVGSVLGGGPGVSRDFHAALEESILQHFPGNHAINCMCHSTENLYRFLSTAVARASDDFYPRDPASWTPHIAACAFNSLFLGALVQPDWDMFQSAHPAAQLHAMARAVSGGAIYVSDKPGQHDFALLRRLVLPDGSVLRCRLPGRPVRSNLFQDVLRDKSSLLRVWNINDVVGVVGVFNLQGAAWDRLTRKFTMHDRAPRALLAGVAAGDVEALVAAGDGAGCGANGGADDAVDNPQFVGYTWSTGELRLLADATSAVQVALGAGGSELVWFARMLHAPGGVAFAPLGLPAMYNGGGAVLRASLDVRGGSGAAPNGGGAAAANGGAGAGAVGSLQLRGCGSLLMYASRRPASVWVNLAPRDFEYEEAGGKLTVEVPQASDLCCEVQVMF